MRRQAMMPSIEDMYLKEAAEAFKSILVSLDAPILSSSISLVNSFHADLLPFRSFARPALRLRS